MYVDHLDQYFLPSIPTTESLVCHNCKCNEELWLLLHKWFSTWLVLKLAILSRLPFAYNERGGKSYVRNPLIQEAHALSGTSTIIFFWRWMNSSSLQSTLQTRSICLSAGVSRAADVVVFSTANDDTRYFQQSPVLEACRASYWWLRLLDCYMQQNPSAQMGC